VAVGFESEVVASENHAALLSLSNISTCGKNVKNMFIFS
jgi:hypothetical protein